MQNQVARTDVDGPFIFEAPWEPTDNGVVRLLAWLFLCAGGGFLLLLVLFLTGMGESTLSRSALVLRMVSVAVPCGMIGFWLLRVAKRRIGTFRGDENAVSLVTRTRERRLPYSELATFSFNAVAKYTHTSCDLHFHPVNDQAGKPLKVTFALHREKNAGQIAALDRLRNHIASVLANRMLADVQAGKPVSWNATVTFTRDGLEIGGRDKHRQTATPKTISYGEITGFDFHQGTFYLTAQGREKPVLAMPTSGLNFYPGLLLLLSLGEQMQHVHVKRSWWDRLMDLEDSFKLTKS